MTTFRFAVSAFGFLLATAPARADDAADARALVEKAITASGGRDKIEKFQGHTFKLKGPVYGQGKSVQMSGTITTQGSDQQRFDMEVDVEGETVSVVLVINGNKGWTKTDKGTTEMGKDELAETKEQLYAGWVEGLTPLKDKQFTLATLGETKVEKREALGVKVSSKGHRDVKLYFDKETGLLVKSDMQVKDDATGQLVRQEGFLGEFKEVQGIKQPTRVTINRNGKPYTKADVTDIRFVEKFDASTFEKP